ncbi:MAG TPA: glycosyltransferase [Vicinamibacterales bacterium]|nr:glycosyltransferase [Vicinamibacterales bacterium]
MTRIALVHDWLTGMRGGERVLEVLCERFPEAELFTLVHVRGTVSPAIERLRIHTSALQWLPGVRRYYRECLPLFPTLIEQFDFDPFDVVVSSSHCVAKSVVRPGRARHLCYCHTPMRYAWDQFEAYFGAGRIGRVPSAIMRRVMARLARWDRDTAGRVDRYVTNSQYVAGRIGRYYNREATVVYAPVDTDFFQPAATRPEPFALVVSALVPYKRLETAIEACERARVPLKIAGDGPERASLERFAAGRAEFLGRVPDETVRDLYQRAAVVLLPGEEDFGIVPIEAQACGRPVVAFARGGALESVVDGETGVLVADAGAEAFAGGIARAMAASFDPSVIRRHAERFSRSRFGDEMEALVRSC